MVDFEFFDLDFVEDPGGSMDDAKFQEDIFEAGGEELSTEQADAIASEFKLADDAGKVEWNEQTKAFEAGGEELSGEKFESQARENISNDPDTAAEKTAENIAESIGLDYEDLSDDAKTTLKDTAQQLIENKIQPAMDVEAKTKAGNKVSETVGNPGEGVTSNTFQKGPDGKIELNSDGDPIKDKSASDEDFDKEKEKYNKGKEEFEKMKSDNDGIKNRMDELEDRIKERAKEGKEGGKESKVGDWLKYAAMGLAGLSLFDAIHQHQNAMNGCWQVSATAGGKIKIPTLTCDKDAAQTNATTQLPNNCPVPVLCQDVSVTKSQCYVPCKDGNCTATGTNQATVVLSSPSPSVSPSKTTACGTFLQPCSMVASGGCHPMCNTKLIPTVPGTSLQCVNVDFWGAAMDLAENPWELTSGIWDEVKKWLIIILIVFVIIIVGKLVWNHVMEGSGPSAEVHIKSDLPTGGYSRPKFNYPNNFQHGNFN